MSIHTSLLNTSERVRDSYRKHRTVYTLLISLLLVAIGAFVFYVRYPFAYNFSNFYAEDGRVFIKNIIDKGPVAAMFTPFNGYLIVGQYLAGVCAEAVNGIFGHGFVTLAKAIAVTSYVFWGLICALPFILFRKRLGIILAAALSIALWSTPFGSYDYAVIGTIGNLKFAFLFIATMLVILRNDKLLITKKYQFYLIDLALLVCVLTNIVSVAVLPFILVRYIGGLSKNHFKWTDVWAIIQKPDFISIAVLAIISAIYIIAVNVHGIPALPGYLDGPLEKSAIPVIAYRSTVYGLTFPINSVLSSKYSIAALAFLILVFIISMSRRIKENKTVVAIGIFALLINVAGFVANRPGVTSFFLTPSDQGWPGLFFYAGTMVTLFLIAYLLRNNFNQFGLRTKLAVLLTITGLTILVLPTAGFTREDHYGSGKIRPTLSMEVKRVCSSSLINNDTSLEIYPSKGWTMELPSSIVCR